MSALTTSVITRLQCIRMQIAQMVTKTYGCEYFIRIVFNVAVYFGTVSIEFSCDARAVRSASAYCV